MSHLGIGFHAPSRASRPAILDEVLARFPRAVKLVGAYSGGDDSGGYDAWYILAADGSREDIDYELGKLEVAEEDYVRNPEARDWRRVKVMRERSLVERLENVYHDAHGYGSFAGEFSVSGKVTIDLASGAVENHGSVSHTDYSEF